MFRSIVWLVGGLASLLSVSPLAAQEAVLAQNYGSGVHAYFAGDFVKSYEMLTATIQGGSKDPRAYYFRGLAYLKLGRSQEAEADFNKGAELECKDTNRFYNVGKALERVQGSTRAQLESHRVTARMVALEEETRIRKARYEAIRREEARVLREQAAAAPAEPAKAEAPPKAPNADDDPFATPEEVPAAKAEKEQAEEDPFAADESAKPEKQPENAAPQDEGKSPKAEEKPKDEKDPFAEDSEEKDAAKEKKPEEKKAEGDDNDPFAS